MYKRNCRICKNDFEADNSHLKICKSCKEEKLRLIEEYLSKAVDEAKKCSIDYEEIVSMWL